METINNEANKIVLSKSSGNEELKLYFWGVLEASKSGNEFPVNLDEVWPLAYSQKRDAIRQLQTEQFIEGVDFIACQNGKVVNINELQNGIRTDIKISVSCLEFLIARKVRAVFEIYRQVFHGVVNNNTPSYQIADPIKRAEAWIEEQKEKIALENKVKADKPKVEFFDAVADSKTAVSMNEVAKCLAIPGYGRNNLFKFLRNKNILMDNNLPYQEYIDRGYFRVIEQKWTGKDGMPQISYKTLAYQKGLDFIRKIINDEKKDK